MKENIGPAANGIFRGKLPSLEARIVLKVVQRLEEVED